MRIKIMRRFQSHFFIDFDDSAASLIQAPVIDVNVTMLQLYVSVSWGLTVQVFLLANLTSKME